MATILGGDQEWRNAKGQLHREDGPAVERADGAKAWYVNGRLHREGGPAFERADGSKEWWVNGEKITEDDLREQRPPMKVDAAHLPRVSF